jgi:signal transduction histidine kinase
MPVSIDWPRTVSLAVHELRSPVNVMGGYLKMLRDNAAHPLDDHQRRLVELALASWTRTAGLLNDLSELSKLESGAVVPRPGQVDLASLLGAVLGEFTAPLDSSVTADIRGETAGQVHGDADRLRRSLASCLAAIARELPLDGHAVIDVRPTTSEGRVPIVIADAALASSLSDSDDGWEQLDEWRGGLGLELPLARRIVEAAGGALRSPSGARKSAIRCDLSRARDV